MMIALAEQIEWPEAFLWVGVALAIALVAIFAR